MLVGLARTDLVTAAIVHQGERQGFLFF
jgi:hypothetical protein